MTKSNYCLVLLVSFVIHIIVLKMPIPSEPKKLQSQSIEPSQQLSKEIEIVKLPQTNASETLESLGADANASVIPSPQTDSTAVSASSESSAHYQSQISPEVPASESAHFPVQHQPQVLSPSTSVTAAGLPTQTIQQPETETLPDQSLSVTDSFERPDQELTTSPIELSLENSPVVEDTATNIDAVSNGVEQPTAESTLLEANIPEPSTEITTTVTEPEPDEITTAVTEMQAFLAQLKAEGIMASEAPSASELFSTIAPEQITAFFENDQRQKMGMLDYHVVLNKVPSQSSIEILDSKF